MAFRVPVLEKFAWQEPINGVVTAPVGGESKGARYVVAASATGDFTGHEGSVAWYDGSSWQFDTATAGWKVYNKQDGVYWTYGASGWTNQETQGGLTLTGDINSESTPITWDLIDNNAAALSFDSSSLAGILKIDTTTGAEKVDIGKDLVVEGSLTVLGTTTTLNSQELTVEDTIFTINKNGTTVTARGAGMEIAGDSGAIVGYFKTNTTDDGYLMSGLNGKVLNIKDLEDATLSISGDLNVEAASAINQDLTTDAAPTFAGLDLNGNIDATSQQTHVNLGTTDNAISFDSTSWIMKVNATPGSEKVSILDLYVQNGLEVDGNITLQNGGLIDNSVAGTVSISDGTNAITIVQAKKAFDSRARWDADLGCVIFPGSDVLDARTVDAAI